MKYVIRKKRKLYIEKIEASFRDNARKIPKFNNFRKYHKAILNHRFVLNPVITFNNRVAKSPEEKEELFNDYFCSVFRPAARSESCSETPISWEVTPNQLTEITVTRVEIATYLSNLDSFKATGPDGIHGRTLKECSSVIAPSLYTLFNYSLHSILPTEWKSADITPVHKKEKKEPAINYRPISLLSVISKVLKRCVYNRLYPHVKNSIKNAQHEFLSSRSCVTQLVLTLHQIGQSLDSNIQTDALFFDFAKAFDSVDHGILLATQIVRHLWHLL